MFLTCRVVLSFVLFVLFRTTSHAYQITQLTHETIYRRSFEGKSYVYLKVVIMFSYPNLNSRHEPIMSSFVNPTKYQLLLLLNHEQIPFYIAMEVRCISYTRETPKKLLLLDDISWPTFLSSLCLHLDFYDI